ncbi:MAG: methyltransferase domain-containing protein [Bacteroidota bacterium]
MNSRTFQAKDAHKLEDPERLRWLPPGDVVAALQLRKGTAVADIGAGTGYFTLPIATAVGEKGQVFAVDFQEEMLLLLQKKLQRNPAAGNITLVRGEASATTLPSGSVDLKFLANVWHELDDHPAVLKEARRIIRPDGRIAILDWRPDVTVPPGPPREHRIAAEAVADVLRSAGWKMLSLVPVGTYSYLVQAEISVRLP